MKNPSKYSIVLVIILTLFTQISFSQLNWTIYNTTNSGLHDNSVSDIAVDTANNILFSSRNYLGIVKFDGNTWVSYNEANGDIPFDNVTNIIVDNDNNKWITSSYIVMKSASGLGLYNDTGFASYQNDCSTRLRALEYFNNELYIGSFWNGLYIYDGVNFNNYMCNLFSNSTCINAIDFDSNDNVWMCAQDFLDIYILLHAQVEVHSLFSVYY
jgi:ligand-binding sensor domain-containing protein